jgi:hypothetical protein
LLSISDTTFYERVFGTACLNSSGEVGRGGIMYFIAPIGKKLVFINWAVYEYYFM